MKTWKYKKKSKVLMIDCTAKFSFTKKGGGYRENTAFTEFLREMMCSSWWGWWGRIQLITHSTSFLTEWGIL